MSRRNSHIKDMVSTKHKSKVLLCSTPEHRGDSPSRDSDSICDSEAGSPVPFLCTQDGAEGETDVVWNFYTPKAENTGKPKGQDKNSTPLSRRSRRCLRPKLIEKHIPKKRIVKQSHKNNEVFQELMELNKNLNELITKKNINCITEKYQSGSEDDIFNESLDCSPKCVPKSSSHCLRKNVLSSNFGRADTETALESDDSMNECLLKASQVVEEKILNVDPIPAKRTRQEKYKTPIKLKTDVNLKFDNDSMDAILNSIKLQSPAVTKVKKMHESPSMNNDSFDSILGNLNDSTLEQLTQMPIKTDLNKSKSNLKHKDWTIQELVVHDSSPSSKSFFSRHNSMPESPSVPDKLSKPSTSGMVFGRYNSMPYYEEASCSGLGDSPIRCTPDEIKKKHQLAREKLMAKRLLPFTSTQTESVSTQLTIPPPCKKGQFQPKVASSGQSKSTKVSTLNHTNNDSSSTCDLKQLIEKKRQEALMKLRRRQPLNK